MKIDVDKKKQLRGYQILLGSILLLFLYVFINKILPEYFYFIESVSEYNEASNQLDEELNWKENSIELRRDINKLKDKISKINLNIPSSREISEPLNLLVDSLLQNNKIKLQKLQVMKIDSAKQYIFVELKLNIKCIYKNLKSFMNVMENNPVIFTVKSINTKLNSLYRRELDSELTISMVLKR